ncbi:hypothetical protein BsWGS_10658 [Bradybaena similaris]
MDLGIHDSSVKYRRRLDRSPDKNFAILEEDDQTRLNRLRASLEEAKSRILTLRDENDDKDYIIEEERKLRQAAEQNLQKHLVDLYNNPEVISELQHRLPRARKIYTLNHEPVIKMDDHQEPANLFNGITDVREDMTARYSYRADEGGATSDVIKKNRNQVVLDVISHPLPAASYGQQKEDLHHLHENTSQHLRSRQLDPSVADHHYPSVGLGPAPGSSALDPGQAWSSLMSISQLLPPYISPDIYVAPASPASCSSGDSSIYLGLPQAGARTVGAQTNHSPTDQRSKEQMQRSQVKTSKQKLAAAATQTRPEDVAIQGNSVQPEYVSHNDFAMHQPEYVSHNNFAMHQPEYVSHNNFAMHQPEYVSHNNFAMHQPTLQFSTHSTSLPSLHHLGNAGPTQSTFPAPRPTPCPTHRYFPAKLEADNVSQTSRLLVEIATLKKENEELRDRLTEAKRGLETLNTSPKHGIETLNTSPKRGIETLNTSPKPTEDVSLDRLGSLIEEIRMAEKKRDVALKALVADVDVDRPTEVDHHERSKKTCVSRSIQTGGFSDSEFSETEDLYGRLPGFPDVAFADSVGEFGAGDRQKLKYVELQVARQREIMKVELQKVLDERNEARQMVMKLEKKVTMLELSCYKDNRANALLAKLRVAEKERDMAVARLKYMTQDVSETKLMYRLHKALLTDSPVNQVSLYPEPKTSNLDIDPTEKKPMNVVLSKEAEWKAKLEAKILSLEQEKKSQSQQIDKLQQLVERQRQKINTLCAGPMLMEPN